MAQISLNFGDGSSRCGHIDNGFNNFNISDEDAQIMRWLHWNRVIDIRASAQNGSMGSGTWLLEMREFREWRCTEGGADSAVMFCPGNPGVGKTYLR